MRILKCLFILCAMIGAKPIIAQSPNQSDMVTLKSGAVYQGQISEFVPGESATIVLADGRSMTFDYSEVRNVSFSGNKHISIKKNSFQSSSGFGAMMGSSEYTGVATSIAFNTVNGYRLGRSSLGIGTGFEVILQDLYVPLYLDYSFNIMKGPFTPFIAVQGGYVFNPSAEEPEEGFYWYYQPDYRKGPFLGTEVGVRNYFTSNFGMTFSVGYRYYQITADPYDRYLSEDLIYPVTNEARLHRVFVRMGILIN